jgi:hypothetical protein
MITIGEPGWEQVRELTAEKIRRQLEEGTIHRDILYDVLDRFEKMEDWEICSVIREALK